jgi:hypothetical protein
VCVSGGDVVGPGPCIGDFEQGASCGAHESPCDAEDAQPQPFGFVSGGRAGQGQSLGPGEEVCGQGGDRKPDPVVGQVVEGYLEPPVLGP